VKPGYATPVVPSATALDPITTGAEPPPAPPQPVASKIAATAPKQRIEINRDIADPPERPL
jgi:hypothetical protein